MIQLNFQSVGSNNDLSFNTVMNFPVSLRGITLTANNYQVLEETLNLITR
jgi:hypothetical protein